MAMESFFSFSFNLLLLFYSFFFIISSLPNNENDITLLTLKVVDIESPILDLSSSLPCERIQVSGISRLKIRSYFNSYNISLASSVTIPENKIKVCFHNNNTLGWCQCEEDKWKGVEKGKWGAIMSPYETRYIDVKIDGELSGSVTVSLEEEKWELRVFTLAFGLFMMLLGKNPMPRVFVKWTTLAIGTTFVLQSTLDIPLAFGALVFCVAVCKFFLSIESQLDQYIRNRIRPKRYIRPDFPMRDVVSSPQTYSTIHNIDNRENLTKEEWDYFTSKSTRQALRELAASKTFTDWLIEHPDRLDRMAPRLNCDTSQDVAKLVNSPGFIRWFGDHIYWI